ncbi:MAG: hypothetical protein H0T10_08450 [Actinobacteria bacterium]|nr:hypothetical protein [Actinomycetota bacterium]
MRNGNGGPPRPGSAGASVAAGLLSVALLPAAITATRWSREYELLHAAVAIPVALLLGALAVALSRRARSRLGPTLGRPRGARTARLGRLLGILGVLLALTATGSVGIYALLSLVAN